MNLSLSPPLTDPFILAIPIVHVEYARSNALTHRSPTQIDLLDFTFCNTFQGLTAHTHLLLKEVEQGESGLKFLAPSETGAEFSGH